jgi:hypothetical protein
MLLYYSLPPRRRHPGSKREPHRRHCLARHAVRAARGGCLRLHEHHGGVAGRHAVLRLLGVAVQVEFEKAKA